MRPSLHHDWYWPGLSAAIARLDPDFGRTTPPKRRVTKRKKKRKSKPSTARRKSRKKGGKPNG